MVAPEPQGPKPREPERPRRRRWLWRGPLGCLALGLGALVALAALLPSIVAEPARRWVESDFGERHHGTLSIARLELAWLDEQRVGDAVLRDPDGAVVARGSAELPPLADLLRGGLRDLGTVRLTLDAELVADDAGVTNLDRALAPREAGAERRTDRRDGEDRDDDDGDRFGEDVALELVLEPSRVRWQDARTRAAGAPFALEDLRGRAQLAPGRPLVFELDGDVASGAGGALTAKGELRRPFASPDDPEPPEIDASVDLRDLPSGLVDAVLAPAAALPAPLEELVGPRLTLRGRVRGTPRAGAVELSVDAERLEVRVDARASDGRLALADPERPWRVAWTPTPSSLAALAERLGAPAGTPSPTGSDPVTVVVRRLDLPLEPLLAGDPPEAWPEPGAHVAATLTALPTALADAVLGQDGLLVDALGPRLEATVDAAWPATPERPIAARLSSGAAWLEVTATLVDGVLVASGEGLRAEIGLTPLVSERVVGPLLPLVVDLSKPEGAEPVRLAVRDFRLPLEGGVTDVVADVSLDLGRVLYRFLPAVDQLLAAQGLAQREAKVADLARFDVHVEDGQATYEGFPLSIEGEEYVFRGGYDLRSGALQLATEVPLRHLGGSVGREIERAREWLDPDLEVPVEIGGTLQRPRLSIDQRFLEGVVEEALQGAVQKELRRGLDKLLGKDG